MSLRMRRQRDTFCEVEQQQEICLHLWLLFSERFEAFFLTCYEVLPLCVSLFCAQSELPFIKFFSLDWIEMRLTRALTCSFFVSFFLCVVELRQKKMSMALSTRRDAAKSATRKLIFKGNLLVKRKRQRNK
jgi:hypothetical protein